MGLLFSGVDRAAGLERTESLVISGPSGERQNLTTYHKIFDETPMTEQKVEHA